MVENPRHLHEIQTHRQETQIPKNLCKKSCRSDADGSCRHGKVRKQEQGLSMDPNSHRNSKPIRLHDTRLQKGYQEHEKGR